MSVHADVLGEHEAKAVIVELAPEPREEKGPAPMPKWWDPSMEIKMGPHVRLYGRKPPRHV